MGIYRAEGLERLPAMNERPLKSDCLWMAFSAAGWPVPFVGVTLTKKALEAGYRERYGHSLEAAGYRVQKVRIDPLPAKGGQR